MSTKTPSRTNLAVDVAILLKNAPTGRQDVAIDRKLVDFLLAVGDTGSIAQACKQTNCSKRYAQRMIKRFTDETGMELLRHRGRLGTEITAEALRCIALYISAQNYAKQIMSGEYPANP